MRYIKILSLGIIVLALGVGSLRAQGSQEAANATKEGIEASKAKDWDKAIAAFRKAAQLEPRYAPNLVSALRQRAIVYRTQQKFPEAAADLSEAIKIKSNDPDIFEQRGYVEMQIKDYDKALGDYSEAIKLKPDEPKYYQVRAFILQTKNDFKGALADVNKVLQFDSQNADAQQRKRFLEAKLNGPATPPPMPTGPIPNPNARPPATSATPSNQLQSVPTPGRP
jgi:tetratricopeptide (TPR) repeat protein